MDNNEQSTNRRPKRPSSAEGSVERKRRPKRPSDVEGNVEPVRRPRPKRPSDAEGNAEPVRRPKRPRPQSEDETMRTKTVGNSGQSSPAARRRQVRVDEERTTNRTRNSSNERNEDQMRGKKNRKGRQSKEEKQLMYSKKIGMVIAGILALVSVVFAFAILQLNVLPTQYVALLLVMLVLLDGLLLVGQIYAKKKAILGKVISILLIVAMITASFYVFKVSGTLSSITGGTEKVDHIVVAVLDEDPAESIQDAADYSFGAQFAIGGEDVEAAIEEIEGEIDSELNVTEYSDMQALALALQSGEVQAIVYNEAYGSIIEDENTTFEDDIRFIYTYEIVKELSLSDVEAANVQVEDECFIVYISGIDVYGSITKTSRSDVNMLAVVNPTTYEIMLINTPRDYYVQFPGVTGSSYDKLTHAGIYGVDTSIDTLEALYDIDIDFYVRVNFTSLIEMVDALGGISVYSEYAFTTTVRSDTAAVSVQQGYNDFDGTEALAFSRERYNVPGGDNQRGINQQEVIKAMIEKATSPAIISGASSLLSSVSGNVDTNMTNTQIQDLIKMQINEGADWTFTSLQATGTASREYCYSYSGNTLYVTVPDYDSVASISEQINAMISGDSAEEVEDTEETTEITVE